MSCIQKYPHRTLQTKYKSIKYFPLKQHRTTMWKWTYAYMHVYGHTHKQTQACTHVQNIKPWEYSKTISHYQRHIHYHQVCHPRNACRAAVTGYGAESHPLLLTNTSDSRGQRRVWRRPAALFRTDRKTICKMNPVLPNLPFQRNQMFQRLENGSWSRGHTARAEEPSSVPCTHVRQLPTT